MKLNCWCCLKPKLGECKATRKEKKACKKWYKENNINPEPIFISIDLGTVEIDRSEFEKENKND